MGKVCLVADFSINKYCSVSSFIIVSEGLVKIHNGTPINDPCIANPESFSATFLLTSTKNEALAVACKPSSEFQSLFKYSLTKLLYSLNYVFIILGCRLSIQVYSLSVIQNYCRFYHAVLAIIRSIYKKNFNIIVIANFKSNLAIKIFRS